MDNLINTFLQKNNLDNTIPFHMPGHKRNRALLDMDERHFLEIDITEIAGADNLLNPEGIIKETQTGLSRLFGAEQTFMLVNGASAGILAAILTCCADRGGLLLTRNSHLSAYNGAILADANIAYVYPEMTSEGIAGGVAPQHVDALLTRHKHIRAVLIVSPTYEGICSDIRQIANITHKHDKVLIVDEAHGAHFAFHAAFPETAMAQGADIAVQSLHKTLPALTQSALLHVQGGRVDRALLARCLAMVQTTSPSYLLMAVMEKCGALLAEQGGALFEQYVGLLQAARRGFPSDQAVRLLEICAAKPQDAIFDLDISKFVFLIRSTHLSGSAFMDMLRRTHGIELEMCGPHHALALSTVADKPTWLNRLQSAVAHVNKSLIFSDKTFTMMSNIQNVPQIYSMREAAFKPGILKPLADCVGKAATGFVVPYPPGIPLIAPGEMITAALLDELTRLIDSGIAVTGIEQGCLAVVDQTPSYMKEVE